MDIEVPSMQMHQNQKSMFTALGSHKEALVN